MIHNEPHILYLTFDGLLEPLGNSQVTSLLERISMSGDFRFSVCSLEKTQDLQKKDRLSSLLERLADSGIHWSYSSFERGLWGAARNFAAMAELVWMLADTDPFQLVHARSYPPAFVAWLTKNALHVPYIFDFRGYWIDEKLDAGNALVTPGRARLARVWERTLYQGANAIVSLARPGAEDIKRGKFGSDVTDDIVVIPTCVDTDRFNLDIGRVRRQELGLEDKLVIGYVGSINPSYRVHESLQLFKYIHELEHDAELLVLTRQREEFGILARQLNLPLTSIRIHSVPHHEVAEWVGAMDWGLLLLNSPEAKRASMPTKLGEFLAAGVRPIHHGCNSEVTEWVEKCGTGISLADTREATLRNAAVQIVSHRRSRAELLKGRRTASDHFGLESGAERYQVLYRKVLAGRTNSKH